MRPKSIVVFDWLFLGSLAVGLLNIPRAMTRIDDQFRADPRLTQFASIGHAALIAALVIGTAISLVLWYFISRRANNVAKWILVAITVYGALSSIRMLIDPTPLTPAPSLPAIAVSVVQLAAMYCLFRKDAATWLEKKTPIDPNVFN
jgi:hypothetical protein